MDYILEEVVSYGNNKNYLIQNNRVSYISNGSLKMRKMKVLLNKFHLHPGNIFADFSIFEQLEQGEKLVDIQLPLVKKGCTTLVTSFPIYYEHEFSNRLQHFRNLMKHSHIDYLIGLSLPIHKLTPSIIQKCQREKLPFINVEILKTEQIKQIIWEWIRDVNFPYQVQLIPNWDHFEYDGKKKKRAMKLWDEWMSRKEIQTINFPEVQNPLSKEILKQLGIYPIKGELIIGSDVDYLLYMQEETLESSNEASTHNAFPNPAIVVRNGSIIKVNQDIFLCKSKGSEIVVKRPGKFKSMM